MRKTSRTKDRMSTHRTRPSWDAIAKMALFVGALALGGCEGETTVHTPELDGHDGALEVSDVTTGRADDAASTRSLDACRGETVPLILAGDLPYTNVRMHESEGWFLVDWGTTTSAIDPSGFSPTEPSPVPPTSDRWDGFWFFGPWATVTLSPQDFSWFSEPVRQAGILGTDFLSLDTFMVDWADATLARAAAGAGCDDASLRAAGLRPLSAEGSFVRDLSRLPPGAVNVPAIPLRIADATAPAQIDTGYDDALVGPALNLNRAFFETIAPAALERAPELDLALTTCVPGVLESVAAYRMAEGFAAELVGEHERAVRRYPDAIAFVKDTPPGARQCGGIGTWDRPGAQLGVSFVARAGTVVFDPRTSRVWVMAD